MEVQDSGRHGHGRHHHDATNKHGCRKPPQPPVTVHSGQVLFRLLCHVKTAGGVIGNSGSIVRHLERETGAMIRVENTVPNCQERVVNVVGFASIDKKMALERRGAVEEECEVSQAQEALVRVFERVWEVEGTERGVVVCRLLAKSGQIGAIMGKAGSVVRKIRKDTGAKLRVLPAVQLPACASPTDELIWIMGGILSVKRALVAASHCIQDCPPVEGPLADASSLDIDRTLSLDDKNTRSRVVFRLLCSTSTVGGVIGKGAAIIRALEKETGASIRFAPPVAACNDRVATISGSEDSEALFSSSQIATISVFSRSIEVDCKHMRVSGLCEAGHVTVRLLVAPHEVDCLIDDIGSAASDISTETGVKIQILEGVMVPHCAAESDKVLQITGEYENVKNALFQVTGRLRENLFSSKVFDGTGAKSVAYSAIPDLSPCGEGMEITSSESDQSSGLSPFDQEMKLTHKIGDLGLLQNSGCHPSTNFMVSQITSGRNMTSSSDSGRVLTALGSGIEHESVKPSIGANRTVEVAVPEHIFGFIYGKDGSNLALIKQISGAEVRVQDPCPGELEGKVILSGTSDQTMAAQSLLQAFISTQ